MLIGNFRRIGRRVKVDFSDFSPCLDEFSLCEILSLPLFKLLLTIHLVTTS